MSIRISNNSGSDLDLMLQLNRHFLLCVDKSKIVSITFHETSMDIVGEDCLLGTFLYNESVSCTGIIRWFDSLSGIGSIRMKHGESLKFYSCNVRGADSRYSHLVSNINFTAGAEVNFTLDADSDIINSIGARDVYSRV